MAHHRRYPRVLTSPNRHQYVTRFYSDREVTVGRFTRPLLVCQLETEKRLPKEVGLPLSFGDVERDGFNVRLDRNGTQSWSWAV